MQQTGKSFYLYVLDKYNLLKHSSVQKTIWRILWIIRLDDWQFKKVCEFCLVQVQKKLTNFRKLVYVNFTLVQAWLQSGEIDVAKAIGYEVCLFSYSYMDSSSAVEPIHTVKTVEAVTEDEIVDESTSINWVGQRRPWLQCLTG